MDKRQRELFSPSPFGDADKPNSLAPWERDEQADRLIATVVFAEGAEGEFDYLVPDRLRTVIEAGRRVIVPLGKQNRKVTGYCVACGNKSDVPRDRLKVLESVVDEVALVTPRMLELTRWIADYYLCGWGISIETAVPSGVRGMAGTRQTVFLSVTPEMAQRAAQMQLSPQQQAALDFLLAAGEPMTAQQLADAVGCTLSPIQQLRRKGLVEQSTRRVASVGARSTAVEREEAWQLNDAQHQALTRIGAALHAGEARTLLIHGVTGSGKTEVYIRAIEEVVKFGRQAIVLVPEISLTPQTEQRFRSRFEHVAVLHSHQSAAERHWQWRRIAEGQADVVVGARSAVFAPTPHLGLIVIDEEHDGSFKQETAPRYHARDVAHYRCQREKIPLVLGSATPSLESYQAALDGRYELIELPGRVLDRPLPYVATIDLRNEFRNRRDRGAISRPLFAAMHAALRADGQVILLLNRRGYAPSIQCPSCGTVVKCPHCDISLTHHRQGLRAVCHYCDYEIDTPPSCPKCRATDMKFLGLGTQRLESEVKARFPDAKCLRMDSDSMKKPGSHEAALARFRRGEIQILLGTQMIAKGLDFPNVTLVGVVNADMALHFPNFRAAERTFQLVTQVAGRTGRGAKGGRVLVQTFSPDHPAIIAATRHDYQQFARGELPSRRAFGYPPFGAMVRLIVRGDHERNVEQFSGLMAAECNEALANTGARLVGPAPAPIAKLRGKFRYHLLLIGPENERLRQAVRRLSALRAPDDVQWIADVDPLDML